ncbi:MAG: DUF1800 family protein [Bacteroidia bacterium]
MDEPINSEAVVASPYQSFRTQSTLNPYAGSWTYEDAAHLLRRCLFGPTHAEIEQAVSDGLVLTLDKLFTAEPQPNPPLNAYFDTDLFVPKGQTWINAPFGSGLNAYRRNSLYSWITGLQINQSVSLTEKMTLFWHNHFPIQDGVVNDPRFLYRYFSLLHDNALGNFKTLTEEITIEPAMLRYLNGNQNKESAPNENYARELFELFTIGKGPQIGPGDYTHYTEQDVVAAARVLTGWDDQGHNSALVPIETRFLSAQHDTGDKTFSPAFANQMISDNGDQEYKDLIAMIFAQTETARYICRKLYRWFVYYKLDAQVEQDIIENMAQTLVANNFEIAPCLRELLASEHFFDPLNVGCLIKNPIDFNVGLARQFELQIPDAQTSLESQYRHWLNIHANNKVMQMAVFSMPAVAGWAAYYQAPQYHQNWINSVTLPARSKVVTKFATSGYTKTQIKVEIKPLDLLHIPSNPPDPNALISDFVSLLLPQAITTDQLDFLKEVLIPGLPDYEWTVEYDAYVIDPNDQNLANSVEAKLNAVLDTMMNMAEFQLS